jgi:pimeloyl-ACP methyl ester carboxylesterase
VHRTVRRYDADFAAPAAGYATPEAYYEGASAHRVVADITTPTLVFGCEDDPIVPAQVLRECLAGAPGGGPAPLAPREPSRIRRIDAGGTRGRMDASGDRSARRRLSRAGFEADRHGERATIAP